MALNLKEELLSKEELLCCVENGPPDPGQDFPLALDIPNGCETRVDLLDWHFKDDIIEKKIENEDIDIILGIVQVSTPLLPFTLLCTTLFVRLQSCEAASNRVQDRRRLLLTAMIIAQLSNERGRTAHQRALDWGTI